MTAPKHGRGDVPNVFASLLRTNAQGRAARIAKAPASAQPKGQKAARDATPPATDFTHLLKASRARAAVAEPPAARVAPVTAPAGNDTADFILRSAAKARGEIPTPRAEPQTDEDQRARKTADRMMVVLRGIRPSMLREAE